MSRKSAFQVSRPQTSPRRADIGRGVSALRQLYDTNFGGKRMGRFVVTRDQVKQMLGVKALFEIAIVELVIDSLEDENLVVAELGNDLFGVVDAGKASSWRKVPRKVLGDVLGEGRPDEEDGELVVPEDDDDE